MTASAIRTTSYFATSRAPRYSVLFALPLLILYEGLAALLGGDDSGTLRNGADVLLRSMFTLVVGRNGSLVFIAVVILVGSGSLRMTLSGLGAPSSRRFSSRCSPNRRCSRSRSA